MLEYMIRAPFQDVFGFPPTCLVAIVSFLIAIPARLQAETPFRSRELLLGIPLVFTVWLIVHGTVFSLQYDHAPEPNWKTHLIELILLMHVVVSGFTIWRLKGLRVYATSVTLFLTCFVLMAAFEAMMSVTNLWI